MPVYGSYVYGSSVPYGAAVITSFSASFIASNVIEIVANPVVVVDDQYYLLSNYVLTVVDGPEITIRKVLVSNTQSKIASKIYLQTDNTAEGSVYVLTVRNLTSREATYTIGNQTIEVVYNRTKCDSIKSSMPSHYDLSVGSNLNHLLTAISLSDTEMFGSNDYIRRDPPPQTLTTPTAPVGFPYTLPFTLS